MKITYLTKCRNCGGSIDEELSKYCPYCGKSLLENGPLSDDEKIEMYKYEDQTVPEKQITIKGSDETRLRNSGVTLVITDVILILFFGLFFIAFTVFMLVDGMSAEELLFSLGLLVILSSPIFLTCFILLIIGIILMGRCKTIEGRERKIVNNPEEIIEGTIRRTEMMHVEKNTYYLKIYIRVEKPKPMVLVGRCNDTRMQKELFVDRKVKLFRKENEYVLRKAVVKEAKGK